MYRNKLPDRKSNKQPDFNHNKYYKASNNIQSKQQPYIDGLPSEKNISFQLKGSKAGASPANPAKQKETM
jgi:hypothetical protein